MVNVFISYSWTDKDFVEQLIQSIITLKDIELWRDVQEIHGGDILPDRISKALDWCDVLILIWSKSAKESRWVKLEWNAALSMDKKVIPCILDNTALPGILRGLLYIDFSNGQLYKEKCKELLEGIGIKASPEPSTLEKVVAAYDSLVPDKELKIHTKRTKYCQIGLNEWGRYIHYEFLASYKDFIGVELHIECRDHQYLAESLQQFSGHSIGDNIAPLEWEAKWHKIGRLRSKISIQTSPENIAKAMINFINLTKDTIQESIIQDSNTKQFHLEFWQQFQEYASTSNPTLKLQKPPARYWYDIQIGRSKYNIALIVLTSRNQIGCEIYIPNSKQIFDLFYSNKESIENTLGIGQLSWQELPDKKASRIRVLHEFDLLKPQREEAFEWLLQTAQKFQKVFLIP